MLCPALSLSGSSSSSSTSTHEEPYFAIPRQGLRLTFDPILLQPQCDFWHDCMLDFILDAKFLTNFRLKTIIRQAWNLQG